MNKIQQLINNHMQLLSDNGWSDTPSVVANANQMIISFIVSANENYFEETSIEQILENFEYFQECGGVY